MKKNNLYKEQLLEKAKIREAHNQKIEEIERQKLIAERTIQQKKAEIKEKELELARVSEEKARLKKKEKKRRKKIRQIEAKTESKFQKIDFLECQEYQHLLSLIDSWGSSRDRVEVKFTKKELNLFEIKQKKEAS